MKYFEEKVVPYIKSDQQPDPVVHENELGGFIDAVIDTVETGKIPKVIIVKVQESTYMDISMPFVALH